MSRSANRWCFTVNLGVNEQVQHAEDGHDGLPDGTQVIETYAPTHGELPRDTLYIVWQYERAPTTGMLHINGYLRLPKKTTMGEVKRIIDRNDAHLEIAKGTETENRGYCTKVETRVEKGEELGTFDPKAGVQGKRSDLEQAAARITSGATMAEVAQEFPGDFIRYHAGFRAFQLTIMPPPPATRDTQALVLWGPTGTGKTHRARTHFPNLYSVQPGRGPWDQYTNQETILFDEFDWTAWPITDMNQILDKYQYTCQCRYNNKQAYWDKVIICSNTNPASWYSSGDGPTVDALRRRITGCCRLIEAREDLGGPTWEQIGENTANPF